MCSPPALPLREAKWGSNGAAILGAPPGAARQGNYETDGGYAARLGYIPRFPHQTCKVQVFLLRAQPSLLQNVHSTSAPWELTMKGDNVRVAKPPPTAR